MTLLKKEADTQPEFDPAEAIKMEKFIRDIKGLAIYLGNLFSTEKHVTCVDYYDECVLKKTKNYYAPALQAGQNFLCVTGNKGKSKSPYFVCVIENIFPVFGVTNEFSKTNLPYNSDATKYGITEQFCDKCGTSFCYNWRDDIHYPQKHRKNLLTDLLIRNYRREYNVFWNLFLLALDDDAYNEQLSNVVELAHYWDFDEPMMRDWCRAVEYVLAGNKLSEDCDFECETVEGARFFLHKK